MTERNIAERRSTAEALIREHLGDTWSFRFDRAVRRAGLCDYTRRTISVSRLFTERSDEDAFTQVVLHEIAHAIAGHGVGHGAAWKRTARRIGYRGERTLSHSFARDVAPWLGACPAGHTHERFRAPRKEASCGRCSRTFNRRFLITWRKVR